MNVVVNKKAALKRTAEVCDPVGTNLEPVLAGFKAISSLKSYIDFAATAK